jgi:hypothetical protein
LRSWEQEPQERRPTARERHDSACGVGSEKGVGGGSAERAFKRDSTPREELGGLTFSGPGKDEENPEAVPSSEGGAPEANKALLVMLTDSEGEGNLTSARTAAGDRGRTTLEDSRTSGGATREP